ncbi:hypothetical protein MZE46_003595 [Pseudomonas sp. A4]|nr:hypothetical protein [Pseudomonas sp. S11A4]
MLSQLRLLQLKLITARLTIEAIVQNKNSHRLILEESQNNCIP